LRLLDGFFHIWLWFCCALQDGLWTVFLNRNEVVDVDTLKEADMSHADPVLSQSVVGGQDQLGVDELV
jgi:hypothetical protein